MKQLTTLMLSISLIAGCGGPKAFTRGTYEDPNVIQLLSDEFNENDLQLIAKKMVNSMVATPSITNLETKPIVIVGKIENRTSEHIDTASLAEKVRTNLVQTGRFRFLAKEARQEIAEEYEYQQSGYVDPSKAKGPGQQTSADYLMTGGISSIIQQVGKDKLVYYKVTFNLTSIKTSEIVWTDEKEIRKQFKKRSVGY